MKELIDMVEGWTSIDEWLAANPGKVGRRKIYEWVNADLIPTVRHGRLILIPTNLLHVVAYSQELGRREKRRFERDVWMIRKQAEQDERLRASYQEQREKQ